MEPIARLNSVEARMMAEFAEGLRGQGATFVVGTRKLGGFFEMTEEPDHGPCSDETHMVLPVYTRLVRPDRRTVAQVTIQPDQGEPYDVTEYDTLFWSESAIEKFLVPYLASKYQWLAPIMIQRLAEAWYGVVPSPELGTPRTEVDDSLPFAIGHLPRSEYITIGGEVHLLYNAEGYVTRRPLSEFL